MAKAPCNPDFNRRRLIAGAKAMLEHPPEHSPCSDQPNDQLLSLLSSPLPSCNDIAVK
jgi:hypothetical protein